MPKKKTKKKNNLAVQLMPKSLDQIQGHEHIVAAVRNWIEKDKFPYLMFVSGDSGTGKGVIVHNLIKTTLCLNREPGSSVPCGECAMCKLEPRTSHPNNNVLWIQQGADTNVTINQQFKDAMAYSRQPPTGNPQDYHRYHKFVVFDETQDIATNLLSQLLYSSEIPSIMERNRVTFIAVTMNESKIKHKDSSLHAAMKSRAGKGYIKLNRPSDLMLHKYCASPNGLNIDDLEICSALVNYAQGSYRMLISGYEKLQDLPELSIDLVSAALGCVSKSIRRKFWEKFNTAVSSDQKKELKDYWDYITDKVGTESLIRQILDDLCTASVNSTSVSLSMIKACGECLKSPDTIPAYYICILPYIGELKITIYGEDVEETSELELL